MSQQLRFDDGPKNRNRYQQSKFPTNHAKDAKKRVPGFKNQFQTFENYGSQGYRIQQPNPQSVIDRYSSLGMLKSIQINQSSSMQDLLQLKKNAPFQSYVSPFSNEFLINKKNNPPYLQQSKNSNTQKGTIQTEEPELAYELPQFDQKPQLKIDKFLQNPKVGIKTQKYGGQSSLLIPEQNTGRGRQSLLQDYKRKAALSTIQPNMVTETDRIDPYDGLMSQQLQQPNMIQIQQFARRMPSIQNIQNSDPKINLEQLRRIKANSVLNHMSLGIHSDHSDSQFKLLMDSQINQQSHRFKKNLNGNNQSLSSLALSNVSPSQQVNMTKNKRMVPNSIEMTPQNNFPGASFDHTTNKMQMSIKKSLLKAEKFDKLLQENRGRSSLDSTLQGSATMMTYTNRQGSINYDSAKARNSYVINLTNLNDSNSRSSLILDKKRDFKNFNQSGHQILSDKTSVDQRVQRPIQLPTDTISGTGSNSYLISNQSVQYLNQKASVFFSKPKSQIESNEEKTNSISIQDKQVPFLTFDKIHNQNNVVSTHSRPNDEPSIILTSQCNTSKNKNSQQNQSLEDHHTFHLKDNSYLQDLQQNLEPMDKEKASVLDSSEVRQSLEQTLHLPPLDSQDSLIQIKIMSKADEEQTFREGGKLNMNFNRSVFESGDKTYEMLQSYQTDVVMQQDDGQSLGNSLIYEKLRHQMKLNDKRQAEKSKVRGLGKRASLEKPKFERRATYEKARAFLEFKRNELKKELNQQKKQSFQNTQQMSRINSNVQLALDSRMIQGSDSQLDQTFNEASQFSSVAGSPGKVQGTLNTSISTVGRPTETKQDPSMIETRSQASNFRQKDLQNTQQIALVTDRDTESNNLSQSFLNNEIQKMHLNERESRVDIYADQFKDTAEFTNQNKCQGDCLDKKEKRSLTQTNNESPEYKTPLQKDRELQMKYKQTTDIKTIAKKANLSVKFVDEHSHERANRGFHQSAVSREEIERQESLKRIVQQSVTLNSSQLQKSPTKSDGGFQQAQSVDVDQNQKQQLYENEKLGLALRRHKTKKIVREFQMNEINKLMEIKEQYNKDIQLQLRKKERSPNQRGPQKPITNKKQLQNKQSVYNKYSIFKEDFVLNKSTNTNKNNNNDSKLNRQPSNKNVEYKSSDKGRSPKIDRLQYSKQQFTMSSSKEDTLPSTERKRLNMDPESMAKHIKMKQIKKEARRDYQYKRMLMIFSRSQKRGKREPSSGQKTSSKNEDLLASTQRQGLVLMTSGQDKMNIQEATNPYRDQEYEKEQDERSGSRQSRSSDQTLKIAQSDIFDQQNDKMEALEYNGNPLPDEYIKAKLAFTKNEADFYRSWNEKRKFKEEDRRNTGFHFAKADIFNSTHNSFNEMLESDGPDESTMPGLDIIIKEFQDKADFLGVIKQKNNIDIGQQNINKAMEVHRKMVQSSENNGNLPLPILLRIKRGIFYIPSLYRMTWGVASGLRDAFPDIDGLYENLQLHKTILKRNNMSDKFLSCILVGLRSRPEFFSFSSQLNQIGPESATQICNLLERKNESPFQKDSKGLPQLSELKLINNKIDPVSFNKIMDSINASTHLKRLALSNTDMSVRQLNILIEFIKEAPIQEIDISWNKIPSTQLATLFSALNENISIQSLNLGFVQMNSQMGAFRGEDKLLAEHFPKFCNFLKENKKLIHLNMTSVGLPSEYMQELIRALKRSQSLHCVHLCGNRLDDEEMELLNAKLKPTMVDYMVIDPQKRLYKSKLLAKIQSEILRNYAERYENIYESVKTKDVMLEWMSVQNEYHQTQNLPDKHDDFFMPLVLTKHLGHSEIKNAKHWKISNECYMCDKWKYTLIFWNVDHEGRNYQIQNPLLEEMLEEMILNSNDRLVEMKQSGMIDVEKARVFISGSFTNWEPRKMMLIDELCAHLEGKQDVLLNKDRREFYHQQIKKNWRQIIKRKAQYKESDLQKVGYPLDDQYGINFPPELEYDQLYVYASFIKPGKHQYIVSYENTAVEPAPVINEPIVLDKWGNPLKAQTDKKEAFVPHKTIVKMNSYHQFLGHAHLGDYQINSKVNDFTSSVREFDKNKSVFKDWKLDKPKLIQENFVDEFSNCNLSRAIKDPEQEVEIADFMQKNSVFLKTILIVESAQSYFPVIQPLYFDTMVERWGIINPKFKSDAVTRIFLGVTKNMSKSLVGTLPEKDMSRYQLYESLVRIAMVKYKETGETETVLEGLKILVNDVLKNYYQDNYIWMPKREQEIWTIEFDDLYKTNLTAMNKLWKYYFIKKKTKIMYLEDAQDMFVHEIALNLLPEQVSSCWGLSKQTVNNDIKQRAQYSQMAFVEFLEFFVRLADLKFKDGANKNASLVEKVELLMDLAFPLVNSKRKEVVIEIEYASVSEEDMNEDLYFI